MFGMFKTPPYHDEVLGDLMRSGRHWKGSLLLAPHGAVELIVSGDHSGPDSAALALARELSGRYATLRSDIQASLFEHYEPGREAVNEGAFPKHVTPFPEIASSEAFWPYVSVAGGANIVQVIARKAGLAWHAQIAAQRSENSELQLPSRLTAWIAGRLRDLTRSSSSAGTAAGSLM